MRARNLHADVSRGERRRAAKHRLRRTQMRIHARVPRVPRFHRRRHDRLPEATRRPFPDAATHQSHNRAAVRGTRRRPRGENLRRGDVPERGARGRVLGEVLRDAKPHRADVHRGAGARVVPVTTCRGAHGRDRPERARRDARRGVGPDRHRRAALDGTLVGIHAAHRERRDVLVRDAARRERPPLVARAHLEAHDALDTRGALARDERG